MFVIYYDVITKKKINLIRNTAVLKNKLKQKEFQDDDYDVIPLSFFLRGNIHIKTDNIIYYLIIHFKPLGVQTLSFEFMNY